MLHFAQIVDNPALLCYNNAEKGRGNMESLLELLEYFRTIWYELALKFVPKSKKTSAKALFVCKFFATVVISYQVAAFLVGSFLLIDITGLELLGFILWASSVALFVLQIILGIIFLQ